MCTPARLSLFAADSLLYATDIYIQATKPLSHFVYRVRFTNHADSSNIITTKFVLRTSPAKTFCLSYCVCELCEQNIHWQEAGASLLCDWKLWRASWSPIIFPSSKKSTIRKFRIETLNSTFITAYYAGLKKEVLHVCLRVFACFCACLSACGFLKYLQAREETKAPRKRRNVQWFVDRRITAFSTEEPLVSGPKDQHFLNWRISGFIDWLTSLSVLLFEAYI